MAGEAAEEGGIASPGFSQVETPDRQSVRGLSYTLVCLPPYTAGYTDVSACLVRTVQHIFSSTPFVNTLFLLISLYTIFYAPDYHHLLLNAEMFVRNVG